MRRCDPSQVVGPARDVGRACPASRPRDRRAAGTRGSTSHSPRRSARRRGCGAGRAPKAPPSSRRGPAPPRDAGPRPSAAAARPSAAAPRRRRRLVRRGLRQRREVAARHRAHVTFARARCSGRSHSRSVHHRAQRRHGVPDVDEAQVGRREAEAQHVGRAEVADHAARDQRLHDRVALADGEATPGCRAARPRAARRARGRGPRTPARRGATNRSVSAIALAAAGARCRRARPSRRRTRAPRGSGSAACRRARRAMPGAGV